MSISTDSRSRNAGRVALAAAVASLLCGTASAASLYVGPGMRYSVPSEAAKAARDGDVIQIEAGSYVGDVAVWRANGLTIRGVGGRARISAGGNAAEGKGIWVIKGDDTVVENIEFRDARVADLNGAGIRQEGTNLTVRNCRFMRNQNGILTGHDADSEILVEHSVFGWNGAGDGYSHNMYIGRVKSFTLRYSYSHHAVSGHQVKTRARVNRIEYNRLMDEEVGASSYIIDIPNGGQARVIGNIVQQGAKAENFTAISYGTAAKRHPDSSFVLASNTIHNDRPGGRFLQFGGEPVPAVIVNNIFSGEGELSLPADARGNVVADDAGFRYAPGFDFRLRPNSPAVNAGVEPPDVADELLPYFQYVEVAGAERRPREDKLDAGALEFGFR